VCSAATERQAAPIASLVTENASTVAAKNLVDAEAFLEANSKLAGVIQTPSGLQYRRLKSGGGCHPDVEVPVTVHYDAMLVGDDTPFDSSYRRKQPALLPLRGLIPAWQEGLPLMQEGDIWVFYVHPKLAYGEKGSPPVIPPNFVTVYKVELLKAGRCK
jgi:FKBP-type peptidyl-prolyl cis-trans isomerase